MRSLCRSSDQPINDLLSRVLDGELGDGDLTRLADLLCRDSKARQLYHDHIALHAILRWADGTIQDDEPDGPSITECSSRRDQSLPSPQTFFTLLAANVHVPYTSLFSGWVVAYSIATMVLGIGALIGAFTYISQPITDGPESAVTSNYAEMSQHVPFIGRITRMVDCKWTDPSSIPRASDRVAMRQHFSLASGLMEITYDTGATVILQGPVTYEIDSANGGFLSGGRLTGKVQTAKAKGFAVLTPTAVVTDLGTEFGVEVDSQGDTISHVFRGTVKVEMTSQAAGAKEGHAVVLRTGESVRMARTNTAAGKRLVVTHETLDTTHFIRSVPSPEANVPFRVVAWFRMGEDDSGAVVGGAASEKTINHTSARRHLDRYGSPTYTNDTAAPDSSLAVTFSGKPHECYFTRYLFASELDSFVLEAWVRPNQVQTHNVFIAFNGHGEDGYGLLEIGGRWQYVLGGVAYVDSGIPCEPGKWTHLALVHNGSDGVTQLWINGQPTGPASNLPLKRSNNSFMIGGAPDFVDPVPTSFDGQIDEVRLSQFSGSFDPKVLLCSPAGSSSPAAADLPTAGATNAVDVPDNKTMAEPMKGGGP